MSFKNSYSGIGKIVKLTKSAGNYMFKVNNRNTRARCEIVFIVNFEHISHLVLVFPLLTLRKQMPTGKREIFIRGHSKSK